MSSSKDFILLIPCYNNFDGLLQSIKSVYYPADKFEILIVDDGSTVPISIDTLNKTLPGTTIQIIRIQQNGGIVNALNTGLQLLKDRNDYKYIARLDAGDICHPERFSKQILFLDTHPDIFLLGSWCRFENPITKKGYNYITKTKHEDILKEMHFKCSFIHPTVLFRREVLETTGIYPTDYPHAEDYAFFWRIMKQYQTAILPEKLVVIELSDDAVSSVNYKKQVQSRKKIVKELGLFTSLKFWGIMILQIKSLLPKSIIQIIK